MSNALAIAAVTAVLKDLLDNAVVDHSLSAGVGAPVTVTALPPDRIKIGADEVPQLNLFMYHVAPNAGWRNAALPSRDARGDRLSNPPLALDLYYLLSAYGKADLEAEILLGYAMQMLHETPALSRDAIRRSLAPASPVGGGLLPPAVGALAASDLADQVEQIKLCPAGFGVDELSKLWSAFQVSYRPSTTYLATVVLIESRRSTRQALPVRERNLYVVPFKQPRVERLVSQTGGPIVAGSTLLVRGSSLHGPLTRLRIGEIVVSPPDEAIGDAEIAVVLPAAARAGVSGVQVVHEQPMGTPPVPHRGVESNVVAFVLQPQVTATAVNVTGLGDAPRAAELQVSFQPRVGRAQRVTVLLNELTPPADRPARAYSFAAPPRDPSGPEDAATLTIPIAGVRAGTYLLRAQVDGAESPLTIDGSGRYTAPQVTIP